MKPYYCKSEGRYLGQSIFVLYVSWAQSYWQTLSLLSVTEFLPTSASSGAMKRIMLQGKHDVLQQKDQFLGILSKKLLGKQQNESPLQKVTLT